MHPSSPKPAVVASASADRLKLQTHERRPVLLGLEFQRFSKGYSLAPMERQRKNDQDMPEATWELYEKHGRPTTESDLPASVYAFPKQRKEPLTDAEHVRNAVARFDQVIDVSDEDRDLAFANIQKAARHYGVNLSEGSWHDLGVHRRKRREAPADAL
jgi:hypothetical protein